MAKVGARIHFQETDPQTEELDNSEEDTSPQGHQQCPLNFVETDQNTENEEENSYVTETEDLIFNNIKETLERRRESVSTIESELPDESSEYGGQVSDNFTHVPYGLQPKAIYEHAKKSPDIMGITYNGRMRRFVILDGKGITTWQKDSVGHHVTRAMIYPKFEYKLITNLVYARKYNVYFALGKDFTLKVLNRDFEETCHVSSDLRSILFMIFNPVRDELITGGVGGTKVWKYHQVSEKTWTEIKPMANYRLTLQYELRNVGGSWVKKVELDLNLQHLYCCSDTDLYAYNMDGKQIFRFERAHNMSITGCAFSSETRLLVTASVDSEVKAWSLGGGLVHTFRGHSRAVTSLLLHPETSALAITSSLDGSVRIWSLHTMEPLYSTVVSTDGVLWMSLTDDQLLYLGTLRNITLWSLNRTATFWAATRSRVTEMAVVGGHQKSTRVVSVGEDNSVRVFSRRTGKNLSTILPPPSLSPLQHILGQTYNRLVSVGYLLVSARSIWIYTTRTDPACRVAVWDTLQIQEQILQQEQAAAAGQSQANKASSLLTKRAVLHRATAAGQGNEAVCEVHSVCYMNARVRIATEEGPCTVLQDNFLLMGLEDGRVLFMDPVVQGKKYLQFTANKDAIVRVTHDVAHGCLWTQCTLGEAALVQVWSLPGLTLEYEVYCPSDVTGYVRLGDSFITAHTNGTVLHHHLQRSDELVGGTPYRPKFGLADDGSESSFTALAKADHNGPVTSIDACHKLGIFCTASPGGTVKVWEAPKMLLTEVVLDGSLCTAAFLNTRGDLVVSFRNHLFYVNHAHVCPTKKSVDEDSDSDYAESEIYEDPAVRYEGVKENPDPVDIKNYLVPFNLDFNQDFLEGKQPENEDDETQPDDDDLESELSAAPTDTYLSPSASPRLTRLDLTLTAQPSAYELRQHMARIQHTQASVCGRHRRDLTLSDLLWDDLDLDAEVARVFSMPRFGESPGPSPTPSPPSTIATPSDFDVSEGGESTPPDSEVEDNDASFTPINKPSEAAKTTTKESKGHQKDLGKRASRLDNIKIDSKQLMAQDAKVIRSKVTEQVKDADHSHTGSRETREQQRAPVRATREVKKKVISGSRKRPRAQSKTEVAAKYATTHDSESDSRSKKSAASPQKSSTKTSSGSGVSSPRVGDSSSRSTKQSPAVSRKQAAGKRSHSQNSKASSKKDSDDEDLSTLLETDEDEDLRSTVTTVTLPQVGLPDQHLMDHLLAGGEDQRLGSTGVAYSGSTSPQSTVAYTEFTEDFRSATAASGRLTVPDDGMSNLGNLSPVDWDALMATAPHQKTSSSDVPSEGSTGTNQLVEGSIDPTREVNISEAGKQPRDKDGGNGGDSSSDSPSSPGDDSAKGRLRQPPRSDTPKSILKRVGSSACSNYPIDRAGTSMSQHKVGFQDKWFNDLSDSNSKNKMHSLNLPSRDSSTDSRHSRSPLVSTPSLVLHPDWLAMQQVKVTDGSAKDSGKDGSVEVKDSGSDASFVPSVPGTEVEADKASNEGMPHTDAPRPPLDPRVPSPTATVVSDYGSEWTMGGAETPQIPYIHIGDIHVRDRSQSASEDSRSPAQVATENVRQAKSAGGDSKTASTDADKGEVKRRPHTAVLLPRDRQELEKKFTHALAQYKVEQSSEKEADPLYKNDGKSFDADKMIERHELLRMQKALRAQSARERRAARDRDHKDRNHAILQRNACRLKSQSDCSFFTPDHHKPSPSSAPSWTDPVSGPQDPSSRPVTAVTITGRQRAHSARQDRAPPGKPAVSEDRVPRPPVTEADRAKSQLSEERPYRARIRSSPHKHRPAAKSQLPDSGRIDLRLIDPRSPLAYRHPGAKSIPSKCTRYVFISPPTGAPGHIVPSALEEQLITERFPQRQDIWLGGATRPPTRTCHGVPSLNPRHLVFNRKGNLHPEFVHMSGAV